MWWKILVPVAAVVVAVIVVIAVTGGDSKADKAMAQVCGARADIAQQLDTLRKLTPGNARNQARDGLQAIVDDLKSIADARGDLSDARRQQVQSANDAFAASVKDAAGSVTDLVSLQSAGGKVRQAAEQLAQSYRTTYGRIDCSEA
jgi:uncharacterized protein YoxC